MSITPANQLATYFSARLLRTTGSSQAPWSTASLPRPTEIA